MRRRVRSGWRNDLIVARIDDPTYQGGSFDPATFEAARFEVISGVPSDQKDVSGLGLSYPAIPLARLNVPPSTGTITAAMITDLRKVALPRVERHLFTHNLSIEETDQISGPVGDLMGEAWPNVFWDFSIPRVGVEGPPAGHPRRGARRGSLPEQLRTDFRAGRHSC